MASVEDDATTRSLGCGDPDCGCSAAGWLELSVDAPGSAGDLARTWHVGTHGAASVASGNLGVVICWPRRGAVALLLVAAACSGGSSETAVSGVDIDEDSIVLVTGCFKEAGGDAELRDGQIVVTSLWGEGRIDGDCATGVPLDFRPGPDVVDVNGEKRFALVGDSYRQIDYCGIETQRCVPFSPEPVPADCSQESLRFATVGLFAGVYPIDVVGCEGRWALVDIETCEGFHGEDGAHCSNGAERVLLVADSGRWAATGFEAELFCPNAAENFGVEDLPDWVCDH